MQSNSTPAKLLEIVSKELTRMLTRSLANSPAADEIHFFVDTMANDLYSLGYDENYIERIEDAFNFFGQHADKWPTTKDIMETIKSRRYIFSERAAIEHTEEVPRHDKNELSPIADYLEKIHDEITLPTINLKSRQLKTINDEDHERLSKEDSVEGIVYRHMMRPEA